MTLTHILELGYAVCVVLLAIDITLIPHEEDENIGWFDWHSK